MTLDATKNLSRPLTKERLFGWQAALFPTGYSGLKKIKVGDWRDGAVGAVSGQHGRELVHFDGPPAERVPREMHALLAWFNSPQAIDGIVQAAIVFMAAAMGAEKPAKNDAHPVMNPQVGPNARVR